MVATLKINKSDIYGTIEGFPLEVVQMMVALTMREEHVNAEEALKILRKNPWSGFTWSETNEGNHFWHRVIDHHEWWRFYEIYPVDLSSPIRYAVVKECRDGCFPDEIVGYLRDGTQLSGKGKNGDSAGFAIKDSPRYKKIIKNGV